jgi:hypothetical protein
MNYENIHSNSMTQSWIPYFLVQSAKENDPAYHKSSLTNTGPSSHEIPLNVTRILTIVNIFTKILVESELFRPWVWPWWYWKTLTHGTDTGIGQSIMDAMLPACSPRASPLPLCFYFSIFTPLLPTLLVHSICWFVQLSRIVTYSLWKCLSRAMMSILEMPESADRLS